MCTSCDKLQLRLTALESETKLRELRLMSCRDISDTRRVRAEKAEAALTQEKLRRLKLSDMVSKLREERTALHKALVDVVTEVIEYEKQTEESVLSKHAIDAASKTAHRKWE